MADREDIGERKSILSRHVNITEYRNIVQNGIKMLKQLHMRLKIIY